MKKIKITSRQMQDTGMAITLLLLLCFWLTSDIVWVKPALGVLVITMTIPKLFKPFAFALFGFNFIMEKVVTKVIMAAIFFLIVTPIGVLMRLFGHDAMACGKWRETGDGSTFSDRNHLYKPEDLERMF